MLDSAAKVNSFLMQYCRMLLKDITDEQMTQQPQEGINHPAWVLGHLALTGEAMLDKLGVPKSLPGDWASLFGPGSKPTATRRQYPSKEVLVQSVEGTYEKLRQKAATSTPEELARPTTNPRAKEALPTLKDMSAFMLTGHFGIHLGQLSSWRRLIGLPPMF
jgi:hypothetical protein